MHCICISSYSTVDIMIKISFTAKILLCDVLLDNFLKPEPGSLVIQCTGRTSFSVDQILPAFIIRAKHVEHVPQKGFSLLMKDPPRGHCQERVTNISLAGSCYRQCPTATEDDSLRGRWLLFQKRRRTRLVGDWTVPDQFGFTFRVELRVTVIDLHQGHARFFNDDCSFFFFFFMDLDAFKYFLIL